MPVSDPGRRAVLAGLAGLPLSVVLADPLLAQAVAEKTETVTIDTIGGRSVTGALAKPDRRPAPAVVLVHEWWGLNDQIKTMAVEFARQGYLALAVDLFQGRVTTDPDVAKQLTQAVKPDEADDTLASWLAWAKNHQDSSRKTATCGWCFGGGWSLNASVATPVDATIVYYGRVDLPVEKLKRLKGPVLGHFGRQDQFITPAVVETFEANMKAAGKPYTAFWYDAPHAFANPTGANYHREDAQLAWKRTLDFLKKELV
ncbi:MAG: dienelactone hydrolase family protein [Solirubrobacterales bacterium]